MCKEVNGLKINKAIRNIMKMNKMSLSAMGEVLQKVDKKTGELVARKGNDISARLNNDNLSFDVAVEMLNVLGYEIVLQKKVQGNRRADQIVINQRDEEI
jgi:hypothetical protein